MFSNGKQSTFHIKTMTIQIEFHGRPLTAHQMSTSEEIAGKRPRRQTTGASRLPQSTSTANFTSRFRLSTPSALPRSVSFFSNFNKNAVSKATEESIGESVTTRYVPQPHRIPSGWRSNESMPNFTTRTGIPTQKREASNLIPQRGLMTQIQPQPSLPISPQTTTVTHHRDESLTDINEVSSARPRIYWLGRYVAVSDKLRNAALPDMKPTRPISPLPSFQIVRSVSTPPNQTERTFPVRSSSRATGCDHLHAMHDRDQRDKRVFLLLREYCLNEAAKDSLADFADAMADARVAKGDDKVAMLRGIGKNLRSSSLARDRKGWLDSLKGKKKGLRDRG